LTVAYANTVDVLIDGYTMRVGNRVYNLGHVVSAGVESFPIGFDGGRMAAVWSKKWFLLVSFLVAVSANASIGLRVAGLVALLGTVGWIVLILRGRATGYQLTLTTALGTDAIISRDPNAVYDLADAIGKAINHPPKTVEQYVVHGDLIQQIGNGNVAVQTR
jgi:hypothetical protein